MVGRLRGRPAIWPRESTRSVSARCARAVAGLLEGKSREIGTHGGFRLRVERARDTLHDAGIGRSGSPAAALVHRYRIVPPPLLRVGKESPQSWRPCKAPQIRYTAFTCGKHSINERRVVPHGTTQYSDSRIEVESAI